MITNENNEIEKIECDNCSQSFFIDTRIKIYDGGMMCVVCIKEYYFKCTNCNDYHPIKDKKDFNDDSYCEDCYSDNIYMCEECDELTHNDDIHSVNDKILCEKCYDDNYSQCSGCSKDFKNDDLNSPADNRSRHYCSECLSENTNYCDGCNEYFILSLREHNNEYFCHVCFPHDDQGCTQSNITSETFDKTNGIKRKFGIEIECLKPNDEQRVKSKYFDKVEDGSIDDMDDFEGEERRSGKMQGDNGIDAILSFCKDLVNTGYIVNKSTGLHVHVNMSDLKDKEIANILSFCRVYDNMLFHLMPKSRRGNTYCEILNVSKDFIKEVSNGIRRIANMEGISRYRGTNIQAYFKHTTLEFRYHSGTIDGNKIAKWVNICLAIVEIGKTRFWAKSRFVNTSAITLNNLNRMLAILKQTEEQKEYWQKRFKKFNNMPVVLQLEESEEN